jgi:hypothetical protein
MARRAFDVWNASGVIGVKECGVLICVVDENRDL